MASLSAPGLPKMIMSAAHLTVREAEQRMDDLLLIPYEVPFRPPWAWQPVCLTRWLAMSKSNNDLACAQFVPNTPRNSVTQG
jgi:hypothetical protein